MLCFAFLSGSGFGEEERRIAEDPFNAAAWHRLMALVTAVRSDVARPYYERLLAQFPTCGRYWIQFAEHEKRDGNLRAAAAVYARALPSLLSLELWRSYVRFVEEVHRDRPDANKRITAAYECALEQVGLDMRADRLWADYIRFLGTADVARVRRAYHRAIASPTEGVESLYNSYDGFEKQNATLYKSIMREKATAYTNTRQLARQLRDIERSLQRVDLAVPPSRSPDSLSQVALWHRYLAFEKNHKHELADADRLRRVEYAYNQCLICLYRHPDMWLEAFNFFVQAKAPRVAEGFLLRGCQALPGNLILAFSYADFQENQGTEAGIALARATYERLLAVAPQPLVHVQYVRFAWRSLTADSARQVFAAARRAPTCTYHVYVAAALLEFQRAKNIGVAVRIFEKGMERYAAEPGFVTEYLDFVAHLNNEANTRPLFKRVLASLPADKSAEVYARFMAFESLCGDLGSLGRLEADMRARGLEAAAAAHAGGRYRFLDLFPLSASELATLARGRATKTRSEHPRATDPALAAAQALPRPDLTGSLVRFYPAGGDAARMPAWLAEFNTHRLPPASLYTGPLILVDKLMEAISACAIEPAPLATATLSGARGQVAAVSDFAKSVARKRKRATMEQGLPALDTADSLDEFNLRQKRKLNNNSVAAAAAAVATK